MRVLLMLLSLMLSMSPVAGQQTSGLSLEDIPNLLQLAGEGDIRAQNQLCHYYRDPKVRDDRSALQWCEQAAQQNNADAQFELSVIYSQGELQNLTKSESWRYVAATNGSSRAQLAIANDQFHASHFYDALYWYDLAAVQGVRPENKEGLSQLEELAKLKGDPEDKRYYYFCHSKTTTAPIENIRQKAKAVVPGNSDAQVILGDAYLNGVGVQRNLILAVFWYKAAAGQGNVEALNNLGGMYASGKGVLRDYKDARFWFEQAANKGMAFAQINLGLLYYFGDGVPADSLQAKQWIEKASAQGSELAKNILVAKFSSNHSNSDVVMSRTVWQSRVDSLTSQVESAEQTAVDAEALAEKYEIDSQTQPANTVFDGVVIMANTGLSLKYRKDARNARQQANNLRRQLDALNASQPPETTQVSSGIQGLAQSEIRTPDAIEEARKQAVANINSTSSQRVQQPNRPNAAVVPSQTRGNEHVSSQDISQLKDQPVATTQQLVTPQPAAQGATCSSKTGSPFPMRDAPDCRPAECADMLYLVEGESRWTDAGKTEVVGFFTNKSIADATCSVAYHKHGEWTEGGIIYLKAGVKHQGGEGGGVWTVDSDSSDIKYVCYKGIDPVDAHGKSCNANIHFTGMTKAGTDK